MKPGARAPGRQLALLEAEEPNWRLDHETREVGRRGVATAREALRSAGPARPGASRAA